LCIRIIIKPGEKHKKMNPFKVCPKCKYEWKTRDDFLCDPSISLIGFMASLKDFDKGSYLFNHVLTDNRCNSTLAIYVSSFLDLYDGPIFEDLKAGSKESSGHCARVEDVERCNAHCRNAVAREIMHKIISILSARSFQNEKANHLNMETVK